MFPFIITVHVLVSIFLIFVILLQPGKGEGMGGAFGGGGSASTVFGGRGSVTFLAKVTEACAIIFMITSLTLAYRSSHSDSVLRARRNLAAQDASKKTDTKSDTTKPALPTGQTAPAPATGGAVVPVPGDNAAPAPAQPAATPPATTAPAKAPAAPAPRLQASPSDRKGK
jgi:preprotein translocase subunit SecG